MKQLIIRICQALCIFALVMGIGLGLVTLSRTTSAISKDSTTASTGSTTTATSSTMTDMDTLATSIQRVIDQTDLEVGVSVIDTASGKQIDPGESAAFLGASTTKVLTAAYFMHRVEEGSATLSTEINGQTANILIQKMLNQSDNAAWASLNDYLGRNNLQTYAEELALNSYNNTTNTITTHDQAQLLAKLRANKLASKTHTDMLLSYMHNTNNETLIAAALPTEATIYHKYGQLYGELHDSAIITYKGNTFILVIFTKSNTDTITDLVRRTQLFHDITDAVLQGFETT